MPIITGTILDGTGELSTAVIRCQLMTPATPGDGGIVSPSVVMVAPSTLADPGVTLAAGRWLLNWVIGPRVSRMIIEVPSEDGTYDLRDINTALGLTRITSERPVLRTIAEAQFATILADRIDIDEDANGRPGSFVADPDFSGELNGAEGFQDGTGKKFKRLLPRE